MKSEYTLVRDTPVTVIPAGDTITLPKGTAVRVTQRLGGSVTVQTDQGLFRIAEDQIDALGEDFQPAQQDAAPASGEFSEQAVWDALKQCYDPEIPVNIVDLGLIYDLVIEPGSQPGKHKVAVKMTLTAPGCGMGPVIAEDAKNKIEALDAVESAEVFIVWDPVWTPQMISDEGRKILGLE
ncbi:MAG: DUF59 domain-containing protein [Verrucomicrobia bacterium]|nr:MAG: DUF59 domain-containing protein [Verrucomicrobiota bacterium]